MPGAGKNGGYFPQCDNRWDVKLCPKQRGEKIFCDECENKKWTKLDVKKIVGHLLGYKRRWFGRNRYISVVVGWDMQIYRV